MPSPAFLVATRGPRTVGESRDRVPRGSPAFSRDTFTTHLPVSKSSPRTCPVPFQRPAGGGLPLALGIWAGNTVESVIPLEHTIRPLNFPRVRLGIGRVAMGRVRGSEYLVHEPLGKSPAFRRAWASSHSAVPPPSLRLIRQSKWVAGDASRWPTGAGGGTPGIGSRWRRHSQVGDTLTTLATVPRYCKEWYRACDEREKDVRV